MMSKSILSFYISMILVVFWLPNLAEAKSDCVGEMERAQLNFSPCMQKLNWSKRFNGCAKTEVVSEKAAAKDSQINLKTLTSDAEKQMSEAEARRSKCASYQVMVAMVCSKTSTGWEQHKKDFVKNCNTAGALRVLSYGDSAARKWDAFNEKAAAFQKKEERFIKSISSEKFQGNDDLAQNSK